MISSTDKERPLLRLLVADDHRMVRAGLRSLLSVANAPFRFVLDEAGTIEEALLLVDRMTYDVILMDYQFQAGEGGGAEATARIMARHPHARVLALSSFSDKVSVRRMVQAGARGYILKDVDPDTLVSAIRAVIAGKRYYSNEVALQWMDERLVGTMAGPLDGLTAREREVCRFILSGMKDREISQRLFISKRTVDKHRQNLMAKLGVHSAVELVQATMSVWG
jgi:DNA-binding NarL/FixJ family response regulator